MGCTVIQDTYYEDGNCSYIIYDEVCGGTGYYSYTQVCDNGDGSHSVFSTELMYHP